MSTLRFIGDNLNEVLYLSWEHIWIVGIALLIATPIGVTLGILITRHEEFASRVLNGANILITIPSIALFGLMLPVLAIFNMGLGKVPAVIALVLYSQLPIIRNTYTAIKNVPPALVDAGKAMGMSKWRLLRELEIPLATPVIIAGLRTAAVMNIGVAAIATYIGAGGLGVFIQQGIARVYPEMVLSGAILVSVLAIVVDGGMALLERIATPEGIRVQRRVSR
ncbi:MAG: ABC transporter permease [Desulfobacterium sp.]|jgi:osmoprotectant transport system permease protein|nr:ABC transporter permease [Desulfobacterium sp.]